MSNIFFHNKLNQRKRSNKLFDEINVTPIVDVVLVLLVVFMLTSSALVSHFDVNLPTTTVNNPAEGTSDSIEIIIKTGKKILILDNLVTEKQLVTKLSAIAKTSSKNKKIVVCADAKICYQDLMSVIELIKLAGFKKISLVTKPEKND